MYQKIFYTQYLLKIPCTCTCMDNCINLKFLHVLFSINSIQVLNINKIIPQYFIKCIALEQGVSYMYVCCSGLKGMIN